MSNGQTLPIVAIVGRPNVGKSTLFNRYARRRRALVHNEPGITRDRVAEEVEVEGRRILLVDTAGLDPAAAEAMDRAVQIQARVALDEADAILFVVDGRAGVAERVVRLDSLIVPQQRRPGHAAVRADVQIPQAAGQALGA